MTSPVERISGPSSLSTSGNPLNGSTAPFTATWAPPTAARPPPTSAHPHLTGLVAQRVDVDLWPVFEEPADEAGQVGGKPAVATEGAEGRQLGHRPAQPLLLVDDLHRPPSEHVRRPHEHRIADAIDD